MSVSNSNSLETKTENEKKYVPSLIGNEKDILSKNPSFDLEKVTDKKDENLSLDDVENVEKTVKVTGYNGKVYTLTVKQFRLSELFWVAFEDDKTVTEFDGLGTYASSGYGEHFNVALGFVVEYLQHHNGEKQEIVQYPLKSKKMEENVKDKWDSEFVEKVATANQIFNVMNLCNRLVIKSLLHLAASKMAQMLKGESLETIKTLIETQGKDTSPVLPKEEEKKENTKEEKKE